MQEEAKQASIETVDMALVAGTLGEEIREAYSRLINWRPGQLLLIDDRYRIERYLGRGGFGLVFAAVDQEKGANVALKFIHPCQTQSERQLRRIEREFDMAQKLKHPGLVRLFHLDQWHKIYFLVMELLDGPTLCRHIKEQGPLEWERLGPLAGQLVDVLSYVHEKNVVHRDIKPSNIIITPEGLKLLDLGMTRELDDPYKTSSTGELVGSPHYLPPELIRGIKATPSSDIYQLALVLYFTMTGRHPFEQEDTQTITILGKQLGSPLPIPAEYHLPPKLRLILRLCLNKDPLKRPQSAKKLRALYRLPRLLLHFRLFQATRTHWKAISLLVALAFIWLVLWLVLPFSHIKPTPQGNLAGYNTLGMKIWQMDTPPSERIITANHQRNAQGHPVLRVLLGPKEERVSYRVDHIQPGDYPLRWIKLDTRGRSSGETDLTNTLYMDYFYFFPLAMIENQAEVDINGDGRNELFLSIRQAESMFPCLHAVWGPEDGSCFNLFCPGGIGTQSLLDSLRLHGKDPAKDVCGLFLSNPFCHYYLWGWNIEDQTIIPPVFDPQSMQQAKTDDLILLPQNSQLLHNRWNDEHWVEFISPSKQIRTRFERSGTMTIHFPAGEVRRYREPMEANAAATATLNQAYFHLTHEEEREAEKLLHELNDSRLLNPWLLSLIEYYRAEAVSRQGFIDQAFRHLDRALEHDPYNGDAHNRRCELLLISQGAEKALSGLSLQSGYYYQFWGLSYGQELFRICCALWEGKFRQADDLIQKSAGLNNRSKDTRRFSLNGMLALFLGDSASVSEAIEQLAQPQSTRATLLDVYEQQLILARLLTLNDQWHQAQRYLLPIYQKNILHKPFAAVPLGWCDIESGRAAEGLEKIRSDFETIQRMARGQFWPRFWLFYDAYAYGRAMEKAGDAREAARGYRACIQANPHTGLAKDAVLRLKSLK